jgi:hypothetical protein
MSGGSEKAIRDNAPHAEIAFDPFHVVRVGTDAVDQVRRDEWNAHDRSHTTTGRWVKNTRWALLKAPDRQSLDQLGTSARSTRATAASIAPSCSTTSCACSTRWRTPRSPRRTSTPGSAGPPAPARPVRQGRPPPAPPPRRRARRHPPRPVQRAPRGPQQPRPAHQPPQLRLSLRRTPHRPHLPVLRRHQQRPPAPMTATQTLEAPKDPSAALGVCVAGPRLWGEFPTILGVGQRPLFSAAPRHPCLGVVFPAPNHGLLGGGDPWRWRGRSKCSRGERSQSQTPVQRCYFAPKRPVIRAPPGVGPRVESASVTQQSASIFVPAGVSASQPAPKAALRWSLCLSNR